MDGESLFLDHRLSLHRYLTRFTGDPDLADDLVQETFIRFATSQTSDAKSKGWMFAVATNLALDSIKRTKNRARLIESRKQDIPLPAASLEPDERVEQRELQQRVRAALARLSDTERTVLLMREEGFKHREIADAVNVSTGSVGTLVARALKKLAKQLEPDQEVQ